MWQHHSVLLEVSRELRMRVSHADYGTIPVIHGTDCISANRLYYCLEACGQIAANSSGTSTQNLKLPAGSVTYIPAGVDLHYRFMPGRMVALHFNVEIFPGIDIFHGVTVCRQEQGASGGCKKLLHLMQQRRGFGAVFDIHAEILRAASRFCDLDLPELKRQVALRNKYADLLEIIAGQLGASLTVERLAAEQGLTRHSLSKAFRRDVGMPLKRYIDLQLINCASELLRGPMNVKETAEDLGFSSEFYFSQFFKKHVGMPPSAFRSRYRVSSVESDVS